MQATDLSHAAEDDNQSLYVARRYHEWIADLPPEERYAHDRSAMLGDCRRLRRLPTTVIDPQPSLFAMLRATLKQVQGRMLVARAASRAT